PLLLVAISTAGIFIEQQQISELLYEQMRGLFGESAARLVLDISNNIRLERKASWYTLIGLVILFFGATSVFSDMQKSINYIFAIKAKPKRGWLKFIRDRLTSFSLVV